MFSLVNHKSITMSTLVYKGYSITSSLGERNIFLKLVDQVSFATYEATVEQKDLRIQHPLCSVYKVIVDSFSEQDENYRVDINLLSGFLKLEFHALVGGFLELRFEVVLREKVVATDALATTKLEQQVKMLEETLKALTAEVRENYKLLSQAEICFWQGGGHSHSELFVQIGAEEVTLNNYYSLNLQKIYCLPHLRKLTIYGNSCCDHELFSYCRENKIELWIQGIKQPL